MNGSFFVPMETIATSDSAVALNSQEGVYLFGLTDPSVQRLLPQPLTLENPDMPMFYAYIVCIREPTFAPWYMEGGIGVLAKYREHSGVYFFGLQLSGPGALMGMLTGREGGGLPKKLCEKIVVGRTGDSGHCYIERKGTRLMDIKLQMGEYNEPALRFEQEGAGEIPGGITMEGGCLSHRYSREYARGYSNMELLYYNSPTRYETWEKARATVALESSIDDPWAEIPLTKVLGAAWSKCDNSIKSVDSLYRYPDDAALDAMQYLFTGRYDSSVFCKQHQIYWYGEAQ